MINVKIKKMSGKLPTYTRAGDACLDCYSAVEEIIPPQMRKVIPLGFAMELPEEYEAVIRPRSGNSSRGIDVAIGTIDETYRGEVKATIINNSKTSFTIHVGDRICQMAVRKAEKVNLEEANSLSDTIRGANGFGSSGVK